MLLDALLSMVLMAAVPNQAVARIGQPAVIRPVILPAAHCAARPYAAVAVTRFEPPRDGAVSLLVAIRPERGGATTELGRVAIFPAQRFRADLRRAQRFGFDVPPRALDHPALVTVTLVPETGSGRGAQAWIGEVRIGAAPSEHC